MIEKFVATLAARDPHLNPPPFRGRKENASSLCLDAALQVCGVHFSPPERGRDRVGVC